MIACHLHDYIEIACLYHLPIKLTVINGNDVQGIAQDTLFNSDKEESISVLLESGELGVLALSQIQSMQAMVINPHFDRVDFVPM